MLKRFLPFLRWYEGYNYKTFRYDFIAGLTVALVLIPQSMAYAQLAGLPAYYGLYAAFLPPIIASLFGSSNQLATGPVAVVSLMTSASLEPLATAGSEQFIAYAILLAIIVGLFQFMLGLLKLGIVVNLLSHPVIIGFTNAAAIIIATSQLSKIFGVYVDKAEYHYETIYRVIESAIHYTHLPTLGLGVLAFAIMIILKRINPKIPCVLIAAVVTIFISWGIGFEQTHKTELATIQSEEFQDIVRSYNGIIHEINIVSNVNKNKLGTDHNWIPGWAGKSRPTEKPEAICTRCHSERDFTNIEVSMDGGSPLDAGEIMKLAHYAGLPGQYLKMLEKIGHEYRKELRGYEFEAVKLENGGLTFFEQGKIPEYVKGDSRTWRPIVKNKVCDESAILLSAGGDVVGSIPEGLPKLIMPNFNFSIVSQLILAAIIISLLGFMEAISIAKAMATRTGQRLDPNQEFS